jgi:serpin B
VTQFQPKKTHDAPFHLADGGRVTVPLMYEEVKCRWGLLPDGGSRILQLPYSGDDLAMVVLLPKLPGGLPAIEKQLSAETLAKWLAGMREGKVGVSVPKFRFERAYDLPDSLKALGMVDAFIPYQADFTGMASGQEPLHISAVAHKAFVEVNEEGTEAAAATAVVMNTTSGFPPSFYIDHPFLFLIRDVKHGTILFLGRVTNPKG